MRTKGWKTPAGVPFEDLSWEQKTYEYARRFAQSRRGFLATTAAVGGTAFTASMWPYTNALAQKRGGNLFLGRSQGSDTLDNHKAAIIASSEVQAHIFDPLAVLDPRTGVVHPSLAASWEFEEERKTVVFKLREDVNFHDGTPFNADAVVRTVNRHRDPATASPSSFILGPLDGVELVDEFRVAYSYTQPFIGLWVGFLIAYASPLSPSAVERFGDDFGRNPVGTGPFKFVSWDANDTIVLERNEDRDWASPAYQNDGASYLDRVEYRTIPEASTRIASLVSGEIDIIAGSGDAVPHDKVRQLRNTSGIKVFTQPSLGAHAVVFSQKMAPMDNPLVRQAISHAMDREKVVAFALDGNGQMATSPLGSAYAQFDPKTAEYGYNYNLEQAKLLLAQAGFDEGLKLSFLGRDDAIARSVAEVLQADLAKIGVELEINSFPNAEYAALRSQGNHHMAYMQYSYSDADVLFFLFAQGSPLNLTHAKDDRLDELVKLQRSEFDPDARAEYITKIQEIVVQEAHWLPVLEANIAAAMKDDVNANINAAGLLILNDVWLDR